MVPIWTPWIPSTTHRTTSSSVLTHSLWLLYQVLCPPSMKADTHIPPSSLTAFPLRRLPAASFASPVSSYFCKHWGPPAAVVATLCFGTSLQNIGLLTESVDAYFGLPKRRSADNVSLKYLFMHIFYSFKCSFSFILAFFCCGCHTWSTSCCSKLSGNLTQKSQHGCFGERGEIKVNFKFRLKMQQTEAIEAQR